MLIQTCCLVLIAQVWSQLIPLRPMPRPPMDMVSPPIMASGMRPMMDMGNMMMMEKDEMKASEIDLVKETCKMPLNVTSPYTGGHICADQPTRYRHIDGSCNNPRNALWGAAERPYKRLLPHQYEDGISKPVSKDPNGLYHGVPLPNPREFTRRTKSVEVDNDRKLSDLIILFGQFIDHDFSDTPTAKPPKFARKCNSTCDEHPLCFNIPIPKDDPRFKNHSCITVERSSETCGTGDTSEGYRREPREQFNRASGFLDGGQIYGHTQNASNHLRDWTHTGGAKLRVSKLEGHGDMLPLTDNCMNRHHLPKLPCFIMGDHRGAENLQLIASHRMWHLEHNRLVDALKRENPHWTPNKLFEVAREIVIAQLQHVTYDEYLPNVLGDFGMKQVGRYSGYNELVNPTHMNEFAVAAFRYAHPLLQPLVLRLDSKYKTHKNGHIDLHKTFWSPERIFFEGGVDPVTRGMMVGPAKMSSIDRLVSEEVSEKLFQLSFKNPLDLPSINLQRGRDHAIEFYTRYQTDICRFPPVRSWTDLERYMIPSAIRALASLYKTPANVELWAGIVMEVGRIPPQPQVTSHQGLFKTAYRAAPLKISTRDTRCRQLCRQECQQQTDGMKDVGWLKAKRLLPDAQIGLTGACILAMQFKEMRDGDRYWYESRDQLTSQQLANIKQTTLGRIICDNSETINEATRNVFLQSSLLIPCKSLPQVDTSLWKEANPFTNPMCQGKPELSGAETERMGDVVTVSCKDGFRPTQPGRILCFKGNWNIRGLYCEAMHRCQPPRFVSPRRPTAHINIIYEENPGQAGIVEGTYIEIKCAKGHFLPMSVPFIHKCGKNGKWERTIRGACYPMPGPRNSFMRYQMGGGRAQPLKLIYEYSYEKFLDINSII